MGWMDEKGKNNNRDISKSIYIYFCVRLDDGIEFFSLFVVLSTYRDGRRRKERGHCFL